MAILDSSRQKATAEVRKAVKVLLGRMTNEQRLALRERLVILSKDEAKALADDELRARTVEMRRRVVRDAAAANAIMTRPWQVDLTDDSAVKCAATVAGFLAKAENTYITADQIAVAPMDQVKKVATKLRLFYDQVESQAEWYVFSQTLDRLVEAELGLKQEEEAQARLAQETTERQQREQAARRIDNLIRESRKTGHGKDDPHIKCTLIPPAGPAVIGYSGWDHYNTVLHPALKDLFKHVKAVGDWDKGVCAEVHAMDKYLKANHGLITSWEQIPTGLVSRAFEWSTYKNIEGWDDRKACLICAQWLTMIEANFI